MSGYCLMSARLPYIWHQIPDSSNEIPAEMSGMDVTLLWPSLVLNLFMHILIEYRLVQVLPTLQMPDINTPYIRTSIWETTMMDWDEFASWCGAAGIFHTSLHNLLSFLSLGGHQI